MYKAKRGHLQQQVEFIDGRLLSNTSETTQKVDLLANETDNETIFTLQLQLETLMHMRKGLIEAKARVLSALAPINLLDDTTLAYIFDLAERPPGDYTKGAKDHLLINGPTELAEVCSRFRTVALATPSLWNHIQFIQHNGKDYPAERLWLERSKPCLLDIDIGDLPHLPLTHEMPRIFNFLLPYFARVEALYIQCADYNQMLMALNIFPVFAPELRYLTLSAEDMPIQNAYFATTILSEGAPKLVNASFTNIPVAWHVPPMIANIETLSLTNYWGDMCLYWMDFTDFLRAMPKLDSLTLSNVIPRLIGSPAYWPEDLIILPVTKITLLYEDVFVVIEILKRLIFPRANDVFMNVYEGSPFLINLFRERNVFATAQKFGVNDLFCPPSFVTEEMIKDSFGLPNVVELEIDSTLPSPFVDALSHPLHFCFPKLQALILYTPSGSWIRSILQFRMEYYKAPPMKFLGLHYLDKPPQEDQTWLRENVGRVVPNMLRPGDSGSDWESDVGW